MIKRVLRFGYEYFAAFGEIYRLFRDEVFTPRLFRNVICGSFVIFVVWQLRKFVYYIFYINYALGIATCVAGIGLCYLFARWMDARERR